MREAQACDKPSGSYEFQKSTFVGNENSTFRFHVIVEKVFVSEMKRHFYQHLKRRCSFILSNYRWDERILSNGNIYRNLSDTGRKSRKITEFSVDTSAFTHLRSMTDYEPSYSSPDATESANNSLEQKEKLTELGADLISYISMKGPLTINDFMSFCLNHPKYGYYQRDEGNKIGEIGKGDFITAPEISQLFGEIIAIWLISTWQHMNKPESINIIELGPGNGTLMADILRVAKKFSSFKASIRIYMIELSQTMRQIQKTKLNCKAVNMDDVKNIQYVTSDKIPISWHSFLGEVPDDKPSLIIGQEFLDIFPVHQFAYQDGMWREKLVDVDKGTQSPYHFRTVIAPKETPAVKALLGSIPTINRLQSKPLTASQVNVVKERDKITSTDGDGIEISPLALATCEDIAVRLRKANGAALLIDYGENYAQMDSIRGFKNHEQVHYLSQPGLVDITVDIDFSACARVARNKGAKVYGPITQSDFLLGMGALERIEQLIDSPSVSENDAETIVESFKMLIDPAQMGKRFKVVCIANTMLKVDGFPETV